MNIFYVDSDPVIAAQSLVDKHCVKMIVETAQLLSTAHRVIDGTPIVVRNENGRKQTRWVLNDSRETKLYLATHINHPSAVWARTTSENYIWLFNHFVGLTEEYKYRYEKVHKATALIPVISKLPNNITIGKFHQPTVAMDDKYKVSDDSIQCYRNYYIHGKSHLFSWKKRQQPQWITQC